MDLFYYFAPLAKETVLLKSTSGFHGQGEPVVECIHHLDGDQVHQVVAFY